MKKRSRLTTAIILIVIIMTGTIIAEAYSFYEIGNNDPSWIESTDMAELISLGTKNKQFDYFMTGSPSNPKSSWVSGSVYGEFGADGVRLSLEAKENHTWNNPAHFYFPNATEIMGEPVDITVHINSVKTGERYSAGADYYCKKSSDEFKIITIKTRNMAFGASIDTYEEDGYQVYPGKVYINYTVTATSAIDGRVMPVALATRISDLDQINTISGHSVPETVTIGNNIERVYRWKAFDLDVDGNTFGPKRDKTLDHPDSVTKAGFVAVTYPNGTSTITHQIGGNMGSSLRLYSIFNKSSFRIQKKSTDPAVANLPQYTFEGIEYTLYRGSDTSTPIKTIRLNASGTHEPIEVPGETYTIKETKTNKWYKLNPSTTTFKLTPGTSNNVITVSDTPNFGTLRMRKRVRKTEGTTKPSDESYLSNLTFNLTHEQNQMVSIHPGQKYDYLTKTTTASDHPGVFEIVNLPYDTYTLSEDPESLNAAKEAALRDNDIPLGEFNRELSMKNLSVEVGDVTTITDPQTGVIVPEFINYWDTSARLRLDIRKDVAGSGASLAGWKFELYDNAECSGNPVGISDATDANGRAVIDNIPSPGVYYLKEVTRSKTHTPDVNPKPVTIAKSAANTEIIDGEAVATTVVSFTNERNTVDIRLKKTELNADGTQGTDVNGIEFTLHDETNNKVVARKMTTNVDGGDGVILFDGRQYNITDGTYVLEETGFDPNKYIEPDTMLEGYSNPAQRFVIQGDEGTYESEFTHFTNILIPPPGSYTVVIKKTSTDPDTTTLPSSYSFGGMVYEVFTDSALSEKVGEITLSDVGTGSMAFTVDGSPDSVDVWVKEKNANTSATHYKLSNDVYTGSVRNGEVVTFNVQDEPEYGSLTFTKQITCDDASAAIPSASKLKFRLTNKENRNISFTQPVVNNRVTFSNIPLGKYLIEEVGLTDYLEDGGLMQDITGLEVSTITIGTGTNRINSAGKWINNWIPDPYPGCIEIAKITDDGSITDYSIFHISVKNLDTGEVILEPSAHLNANGTYTVSNLAPGRYLVKEHLTDAQKLIYTQSPAEETVVITENETAPHYVNITNMLKTTKIIVKKKSSDGKVDGIEFTLHGTAADGTNLTGLKAYTHTETEPVTGDTIGVCEFRGIRAGSNYVIEETGFDALKYTSNHSVAGYDKPAIKVASDGQTDQTMTFINTPYRFELTKTELLEDGTATNDPVADAEYTLYKLPENESGQPVFPDNEDDLSNYESFSFSTDENGRIDTTGITRGTYMVYETVTPEGYIEDLSVGEGFPIRSVTESIIGHYVGMVTFSNSNPTVTLQDTNRRQYGSVTFVKTDEYGEPVQGAEFTLYIDPLCTIVAKNKDNRAMVVTTDKYGRITDPITGESPLSGLEWRTYYLKETKKPTGYKKNSKVYTVKIDQHKIKAVVRDEGSDGIVNERGEGKALLHKVDAATKEPIRRTAEAERAMFSLYSSDNMPVREGLVPDANGDLLVEGLAWGSYYFKETRAPSGYTISPNLARFSINFSAVTGIPQEITMEDSKARASIVATVKIKARDYWKDHGDPTFIAVLTSKDGSAKKMTRPITFTEAAVTANQSGGYASLSTTFDIDSGEYQLKIYPADRFRLDESFQPEPINTLVCDTAHSVDAASVDFNVSDNQTGRATYVYIKDDWSGYGDQTTLTNIIKKSRAFTGLSVMYLGDEDNVEAGMPFTKDLLSVYALYDDGSAIQIGPGCAYDYVVTDSNGNELTRFPAQAGPYTYTVTANIDGVSRTGVFQVTVLPVRKVKIYLHTDGATVAGASSGTCPIDSKTAQYVENFQYQTIPRTSAIYTDVTPPVGKMVDKESGSSTGWYEDKNFKHPFDPYADITQDMHLYLKLDMAKYKVSYFSSAPSGVTVTGVPSQQTKIHDVALTLSGQRPSISAGYDFLGWGTTQNGKSESDVRYRPGDTYTGNAPINLYAVWKPHTATLTYNANGGRLGSVPIQETLRFDNAAYVYSASVPLNTEGAAPFAYWCTKANDTGDIYFPGDLIKNANEEPEDTELFAIFKSAPPRTAITAAAKNAVTCTATDQVGVTSYYFGTSSSPSDSDFVSVTSSTSFSVTKGNLSTGTYYFIARNRSGTASDPVSVKMVPFKMTFYKNGSSEVVSSGATANVSIGSIRESGKNSYLENWPAGSNYIVDNINVTNSQLEYDDLLSGSAPLTGTIGSNGTEIKLLLSTRATLSYSANIGSTFTELQVDNIPASQSLTYSNRTTVSSTAPSRLGFRFTGWNTKANGTGTSYQPGSVFKAENTIATDATLYAEWEQLHLGSEELTWKDVETLGNYGIAEYFFTEDFAKIGLDLKDDGKITASNLAKYTKSFRTGNTTAHAFIAGFDHDELLSGGTAAITFMSYESVGSSVMQAEGDSAGWGSSTARTQALNGNSGIYGMLDQNVQNADNKLKPRMATVKKRFYDNTGTLKTPAAGDKFFLPSAEELYGAYMTASE